MTSEAHWDQPRRLFLRGHWLVQVNGRLPSKIVACRLAPFFGRLSSWALIQPFAASVQAVEN
ncbi:MAG: hypothetical protein EPO45_08585 [Sphingobium sp.]|nr:hypothetical protein [Sphingobium sp.]TAJ77878.1 MAG: hypothetical protein EPO45_08585 [Sphingobium sp.]